jgi:hypothetical protein
MGPAERLGAYWDARGGEAEAARAAALDPELVETVETLHARDDAHLPDPRFLARLETTLLQTMVEAPGLPAFGAPAAPITNGRVAPAPLPQISPTTGARSWNRQLSGWLATAALIALTLVGSFVAFGPARPGRQQHAPAILPAVSEPPALTQALAGPVAEFVWETRGGPGVPFAARPYAAAVDPDGNLWVLDAPRHQFQIFAPDGSFLESWGAPGSGPGELDFPVRAEANRSYPDVAFAPDGSFYVSDPGNFRIQKFAPDRSFLLAWGSEGDGDGQFRWPGQIEVDAQGRVFVLDDGRRDVQVFDGDGRFLRAFGGAEFDDGEFDIPIGLALDSRGVIWVSDYGRKRVQGFAPDGTLLGAWGGSGLASGDLLFDPGDLMGVGGLAIDARDRFFLADFVGQTVQIFAPGIPVFAPGGSYLAAWGEVGSGPGQFRGVSGVVLDGQGNAYVSDTDNTRIQKFRLLPPFGPATSGKG